MSTDLTVPARASLPDKMQYAKVMAGSNLLPRQYQGNPANLLFALEYADALGVSPINAITSIHVIEGKPTASADLIAGLVRRAGHKLRVSGDDRTATAQIIRADDPDFTYEVTWTMDRAKAAGLAGKSVWKQYPAAMLRSRAITEVARMGASDALYGVIYTPEEVGAEVDADGEPTAPPRPAPMPTAAPAPQPEPEPEPEVIEAEVVADPQPDGITQPQLKKMGALMREAGLTDRAGALAFVAETIGRDVESRNDLTKREAGQVIDALEPLVATTDAGTDDAGWAGEGQ